MSPKRVMARPLCGKPLNERMSHVSRPEDRHLYRLIESQLDGTIADFVAARWPQNGWRKIAAELSEAADTKVSYRTLAEWFADRIEVQVTTTVRAA
jgi:hypothetical protein